MYFNTHHSAISSPEHNYDKNKTKEGR